MKIARTGTGGIVESKQEGGVTCKQTLSIRKGSWSEESNLTLGKILKHTYWWCQDLDQWQIRRQLKINPNTAVDWDSFCRETCEVTMLAKSEKIGGKGKTVQFDENKVGKRKYHRGHRVEGQWVFGGVEEDTRKSFLVLLVYWKSYSKLSENGYLHETAKELTEMASTQTSKKDIGGT